MQKSLIYIASPFSNGDQAINTRSQMVMFDRIVSTSYMVPFAPLLFHFQHLSFPQCEQVWIELGLDMIDRCDACIRIDSTFKGKNMDYLVSESKGADIEVEKFIEQRKPVFDCFEELRVWAKMRVMK